MTSSLLLTPSPTRCHRWLKNSIQVLTGECFASWIRTRQLTWLVGSSEGGSETESTADSEFGRGDILAATSSESFFSYKPRYSVLPTSTALWSARLMWGCVLLQRSRGCRWELREQSGPAAGGRAQFGGADEAQTGTRQSVPGETKMAVSDDSVSALTRVLMGFCGCRWPCSSDPSGMLLHL